MFIKTLTLLLTILVGQIGYATTINGIEFIEVDQVSDRIK